MNAATVKFHKRGESWSRSPGSSFGLPADLLQKSRRRIRIVALLVLIGAGADTVLMVGSFVAWVLGRLVQQDLPSPIPFAGNLVTLASAAAMLLAARSSRLRDTLLLKLGLAFEIFLCLIISLSNPASEYATSGTLPNLTWVTPLIILFPLIVPCPPRRTVVIAVLAAATRPIGIWILAATGSIQAGASAYFTAAFSPSIAVVIAYFGSRVVYGLGIEVAEARRMGSYVLERLLGRGGMGEVWLARHRMLARPAAVKLVQPDSRGPGGAHAAEVVLRRFEREAQATAGLRSPHTIELYDFGVSDDGTFYYVMELLDGLDTNSLVQRFGPVPPERAIHILRQVCHSLAEAHEAGLIHRDIKPANVYLCRYGRDFDFVKVLDFGLVKTPSESGSDATLTMEGAISGTPAFMSPEQAKGAERLDARSDLYAVGCLAYWLLTGSVVFEGANALEILMQHLQAQPVPPSQRAEIHIPDVLERSVMACLDKEPARRPQSAVELFDLLGKCTTGSEWTGDRARQWWELHRPGISIAHTE